MIKNVITLATTRTGYSIKQVLESYNKTLTVGELKEILDQYEDNTPIVFSNDNGYTYGEIQENFFDLEELDIPRNPEEIVPGDVYRISGEADEIIADSTYGVMVDSEVTILDSPDESGWVRVRIDNVDNKTDVEAFVDIEALIDI